MPYINPDIFQIDWDNVDGWADGDTNGAVSSINPAGQLYLDCRAMSANGNARREKDLGTIGTGDFYIEMRFKGDVWDGYGVGRDYGFRVFIEAETSRIQFIIANGLAAGDGIELDDGNALNLVYEATWDTNWHTIVFYIHNSQTDCDIWVDKDPSGAADVTDADCSDAPGAPEGNVKISGLGSVAGDGEYHVDYIYIGTELSSVDYSMSVTVGTFTLTGIAAGLIKALNLICSVGSFTLTGIAALFTKAWKMSVTVGVFTLTGIATTFIKALIMATSVGTFTLTGITTVFIKAWKMTAGIGSFILTGIATIFTKVGWTNQSKSSSISPTNLTKNDISPTNITKNSSSFNNQAKS